MTCAREWDGKGRHDHECVRDIGHDGECRCECGQARPVVKCPSCGEEAHPQPGLTRGQWKKVPEWDDRADRYVIREKLVGTVHVACPLGHRHTIERPKWLQPERKRVTRTRGFY